MVCAFIFENELNLQICQEAYLFNGLVVGTRRQIQLNNCIKSKYHDTEKMLFVQKNWINNLDLIS